MECDVLDFSEYGNEADVRSDELLKEALERLGARTQIVRLGREGVTGPLAGRVWLRYDLRSFRDLFLVVGVAEALSASGHLVFPEGPSIRRSEDKWETYLALRAGGVPTVDTFPLPDSGPLRGRAVVKPRVGWGGMGMQIVAPGAEGEQSRPEGGPDLIWQPFVDHRHTWTSAVAGRGSAVLMEKRSTTRDFRTNSDFGEEAILVEDPGELNFLARRALDALGLVAGTVDLVEADGRVVVLEVNSAPCLWYDQLPGLDLAGSMGRAVMEWFDGRRI